jgi:hypothetical protein
MCKSEVGELINKTLVFPLSASLLQQTFARGTD